MHVEAGQVVTFSLRRTITFENDREGVCVCVWGGGGRPKTQKIYIFWKQNLIKKYPAYLWKRIREKSNVLRVNNFG